MIGKRDTYGRRQFGSLFWKADRECMFERSESMLLSPVPGSPAEPSTGSTHTVGYEYSPPEAFPESPDFYTQTKQRAAATPFLLLNATHLGERRLLSLNYYFLGIFVAKARARAHAAGVSEV